SRNQAKPQRMNVRTTAYCTSERGGGGKHNAVGMYLSGRNVVSAASDWSRFPLGTRFRLVDTNQEYIIDDYGGALIGTNTIDLFKNSRLDMKRWGVRHVDIDILQSGWTRAGRRSFMPGCNNAFRCQRLGRRVDARSFQVFSKQHCQWFESARCHDRRGRSANRFFILLRNIWFARAHTD